MVGRSGVFEMVMMGESRAVGQEAVVASSSGEAGRVRVLLVEDAPFLRYAFGRLLRMHNFDVREANDGREAFDVWLSLPSRTRS